MNTVNNNKMLRQSKKLDKKRNNYITKLFLRIFLSSLLLLLFILMDNYNINSRVKIKDNFNFYKLVKVTKNLFGDFISINTEKMVGLEQNFEFIEFIDNCNYITNHSFNGVTNIDSGIITNIKMVDNLYNVTVQSEEYTYVYMGLENIDYSLYSFVESGTILGNAYNNNELYQFQVLISKGDKFYEYYEQN